jgi:hypothetical protein
MYRARRVPLDRVLVGLPLYGMTWATTGPEQHARRAPASVSARGAVTLFRNVGVGLPSGPIVADTDHQEASARLAWFDPDRASWFQTYYDTPATIRAKYLLAHEEGEAVTEDPLVQVAATAYPAFAPVIGMRIAPDGRTWGEWLDPASFDPEAGGPTAWDLGEVADGRYEVWLQAMDETGVLSTPVVGSVLLDRAPPTIDGPSLRPGPVPGSWVVLFTTHDAGGVERVEVRWQVGDADWSEWRVLDSLAAGSVVTTPGTPVRVEVRATDHAGRTTTGSAAAS